MKEFGWGLLAIACNLAIALLVAGVMSIIYALQH